MDTLVEKKIKLKQLLSDILLDISWARLAKRYFGKSSGWMYHKLDGVDGNGRAIDITDEEREHLKNSLFDFAERIRKAAESI